MLRNQTISHFITIIKNARELSRKEKDILINRLEDKTLETIAKNYKLSGERIRQIEENALVKFFRKVCQLMLFD